MTKFCQKKDHRLTGTSRTRQVSRKVNNETCEKLEQSAKKELASSGAGQKGEPEQKVGIFCLPGFVEDSGQICFLPLLPSCACAKNLTTKFNLQIKG
jgi:hypothetical protein